MSVTILEMKVLATSEKVGGNVLTEKRRGVNMESWVARGEATSSLKRKVCSRVGCE